MRKLLFVCFLTMFTVCGCGKKEVVLKETDRKMPDKIELEEQIDIEEDNIDDEMEPPIPMDEINNPMTEEEVAEYYGDTESTVSTEDEFVQYIRDNDLAIKDPNGPFYEIGDTGMLIWNDVTDESLKVAKFILDLGYQGSLTCTKLSMDGDGSEAGFIYSDFAMNYMDQTDKLYEFNTSNHSTELELVCIDGEIFYADVTGQW